MSNSQIQPSSTLLPPSQQQQQQQQPLQFLPNNQFNQSDTANTTNNYPLSSYSLSSYVKAQPPLRIPHQALPPIAPIAIGGATLTDYSSQPTNPSQKSQTDSLYAVDCTCKPSKENHIPRPRNSFILFRRHHHQKILDASEVTKSNAEVSKVVGQLWRNLPKDEKDYWNGLAEEEKINHREKYPGYRYVPRRTGKKRVCVGCQKKLDVQALPSEIPQTQKQYGGMLSSVMNPQSQKEVISVDTEEYAIAQCFLDLRNQTPQVPTIHQQAPALIPDTFSNYQRNPHFYPSVGELPPPAPALSFRSDLQRYHLSTTIPSISINVVREISNPITKEAITSDNSPTTPNANDIATVARPDPTPLNMGSVLKLLN